MTLSPPTFFHFISFSFSHSSYDVFFLPSLSPVYLLCLRISSIHLTFPSFQKQWQQDHWKRISCHFLPVSFSNSFFFHLVFSFIFRVTFCFHQIFSAFCLSLSSFLSFTLLPFVVSGTRPPFRASCRVERKLEHGRNVRFLFIPTAAYRQAINQKLICTVCVSLCVSSEMTDCFCWL